MAHVVHPYPLLFEAGDRLSRDEFLARWEQMPELRHAELIDGVVYMPSPISFSHGNSQIAFGSLLWFYAAKTPGCSTAAQSTWLMLEESAPQPDLALYILPEYGGHLRLVGSLASGAPELIVEIVKSSRSYDLGPKLALYERAEVQEYVAAIIEQQRIEWRVFENGSYGLLTKDAEGIFRSRGFPGLWVDEAAFWRGDDARLMEVLEVGLRSDEHARFVESLERQRG